MVPLRRILLAQLQIRRHKRPLLITYIARIARLNSVPHPCIVSHPTGLYYPIAGKGIKLITASRGTQMEILLIVPPPDGLVLSHCRQRNKVNNRDRGNTNGNSSDRAATRRACTIPLQAKE